MINLYTIMYMRYILASREDRRPTYWYIIMYRYEVLKLTMQLYVHPACHQTVPSAFLVLHTLAPCQDQTW